MPRHAEHVEHVALTTDPTGASVRALLTTTLPSASGLALLTFCLLFLLFSL